MSAADGRRGNFRSDQQPNPRKRRQRRLAEQSAGRGRGRRPWFDAKSLDDEKAIARRLNKAALDHVVYAPLDRLLLGMKGTMSEMELSIFRQRWIEAMKQKAGRGKLFLTVAVRYVKGGRDNVEKDPDRRVQESIALVFRKFTELQTIRQVLVWFRQEKIPLPVLTVRCPDKASVRYHR